MAMRSLAGSILSFNTPQKDRMNLKPTMKHHELLTTKKKIICTNVLEELSLRLEAAAITSPLLRRAERILPCGVNISASLSSSQSDVTQPPRFFPFSYGNTFHYGLIHTNRGRGRRGMAPLITVPMKSRGLNSYYDLISRGKKVIVSAQIDLALLRDAFGELASLQIMTFGQSHTNKQLRQTIRCNYNYCSSGSECVSASQGAGEFSGSGAEYQ